MTETPEPLLVYNRIDANRRKTRRLLAGFVVALRGLSFRSPLFSSSLDPPDVLLGQSGRHGTGTAGVLDALCGVLFSYRWCW
jgi:hypothetical protein